MTRFCGKSRLLPGVIKVIDAILKVQNLEEETFWSKAQIRNNYSGDHAISTSISWWWAQYPSKLHWILESINVSKTTGSFGKDAFEIVRRRVTSTEQT